MQHGRGLETKLTKPSELESRYFKTLFLSKTLCKITVTQEKQISIIAFKSKGRKVLRRDEADAVEIKTTKGMISTYFHLHKESYNRQRKFEKPVEKWNELPMTV